MALVTYKQTNEVKSFTLKMIKRGTEKKIRTGAEKGRK
jgi:hypothetical protein